LPHSATYKTCIDPSGSVTSAELVSANDVPDDAAAKGAAWLKDQKLPTPPSTPCTTVSVLFDPSGAKEPALVKARNVSAHVFDQQVTDQKLPHLPDAVRLKNRGKELVWMAKVCANVDGDVDQVSIVGGLPEADDSIMTAVRSWKLRPQPVPICTLVRFVFQISAPSWKQPH
jgi:hypothetical protein